MPSLIGGMERESCFFNPDIGPVGSSDSDWFEFQSLQHRKNVQVEKSFFWEVKDIAPPAISAGTSYESIGYWLKFVLPAMH